MKRLPILINVVLFAALCAVVTFWGMRFFAPKLRPVAAPVMATSYEPAVGQWGNLFGQAAVVEAGPSNYQVKGVIVAPRAMDSAAIIVLDGKPNFILGIGKELSPGVKLKEVHRDHIIVEESGMPRRIDVPPAPPIAAGVNTVALQNSTSTPNPVAPQPPSALNQAPPPMAPPSMPPQPAPPSVPVK